MGATATVEIDTDLSVDAQAIFERSAQLSKVCYSKSKNYCMHLLLRVCHFTLKYDFNFGNNEKNSV